MRLSITLRAADAALRTPAKPGLAIAFVALALVACGPTAKPGTTTPPVVVAPPPPPPFVIASGGSIVSFVTDATNIYWADDQAIYRRPLGPDQKTERLFAGEYISLLAPGASDLFFVDGDGKVRALPLAGGGPRDIDQPAEVPWALYAEGDTVWCGVAESLVGISPRGRKTIDLAGVSTPAFAAAAGHAYVTRYDSDADKYQLLDLELATGARKVLSTGDFVSEAQSIAVVGDDLVIGVSGAAVALPRKGGKARYSFFGDVNGVAGDARGYVVGGYGFLVTHEPHQPPHLVASGTSDYTLIGISALAVAGDYVYYTSTSTDSGDMTLRAVARAGGAIMLRVPTDGSVTALGATEGAVFMGFENDLGDALWQVGTKRSKVISPSGYIESIVADDKNVVVVANSELLSAERPAGELVSMSEVSYPTPVIHKGKVYWGDGTIIHAASLPGGSGFQVVDAATLRADLGDLGIGAVAFANDHMYFVVNVGDTTGIASVDEKRELDWVWTYQPPEDEYGTLDANVVAVGDHLFVHDGTYIFAVGLDGTAKRIFNGLPKRDDDVAYTITTLYAAGDRLIARAYGDGDELLEIPVDGGDPKTLWSSTLDGGSMTFLAVAADAAYVYVNELAVVLKIPL